MESPPGRIIAIVCHLAECYLPFRQHSKEPHDPLTGFFSQIKFVLKVGCYAGDKRVRWVNKTGAYTWIWIWKVLEMVQVYTINTSHYMQLPLGPYPRLTFPRLTFATYTFFLLSVLCFLKYIQMTLQIQIAIWINEYDMIVTLSFSNFSRGQSISKVNLI